MHGLFFHRGVANLYAGSLPNALADLDHASELDPKDLYTQIWVDIANERSDQSRRLPEALSQLDMTRWPAAVIRLNLGEFTPAQVLAAADNPDPNTTNNQVCEANFYTGELALRRGTKNEAVRLFRLAAADCPGDFIERGAANAELEALDER
jgi:lipoprotein NlpI